MADHINPSSGFVKSFGSRRQARQLAGKWNKTVPALQRMSPDSQRFVTATLDPFHDTPVKPRGFPDMHGGKSFVSKVRCQFNVTRPVGVAAGNWDCLVLALPLAAPSLFKQVKTIGTNGGTIAFATGAADITLGPIQAFCAPSGTQVWPTAANGITQAVNDMVYPPDVFSSYHVGPSRVVCGGFEVRDTSNTFNKQGAVTFFSQANFATPSGGTLIETTDATYAAVQPSGLFADFVPMKVLDSPAPSVDTASALSDTINWEAPHGGYMPLRLESMDNPFVVRSCTPVHIKEVTADGGNAVGFFSKPRSTGQNVTGDPLYAGASATVPATFSFAQTIPFQTSGAYFTGLHQDAVLTVTYVCYVERSPTVWQTDILSAANPSPMFDPYAFELIAKAYRRLPIATKVDNNDSGDWWDNVLGAIGSVASKAAPFLTLIPEVGPMAAGAAEAIAIGSKGAQLLGRTVQRSVRDTRKRAANAKAKKAATTTTTTVVRHKPR